MNQIYIVNLRLVIMIGTMKQVVIVKHFAPYCIFIKLEKRVREIAQRAGVRELHEGALAFILDTL